jgi:hypothetical protein
MLLETSTELNCLSTWRPNSATSKYVEPMDTITSASRQITGWYVRFEVYCLKYKFLSYKNTFILHYQDQYLKATGGQLIFVVRCNKNKKRHLRKTPIPATARSKRESAAARLLSLRFQIPPRAWMSVCCECFVLSGRGLLRRADHSSRWVLPTLLRRWVWSRNLKNVKNVARVGPQRKKGKRFKECMQAGVNKRLWFRTQITGGLLWT